MAFCWYGLMVPLSLPPWPVPSCPTCSRAQWNRENRGWMNGRLVYKDRRGGGRGRRLIVVFQIGRVERDGSLVSFLLLPVAFFPSPYIHTIIHPPIHPPVDGALVPFWSLLTHIHTKIPYTYSMNTSITMCMADWLIPHFPSSIQQELRNWQGGRKGFKVCWLY